MDRQSWVETTCPPGWQVSRSLGESLWSPCRAEFGGANVSGFAHASDGDGCIVWVDTEAAARRLAWERWALEVLGGRFVWVLDGDGDPALWSARLRLFLVTVDWENERGYAVWVGDDGDVEHHEETYCTDPVEALARLAALTLAVQGPEVAP